MRRDEECLNCWCFEPDPHNEWQDRAYSRAYQLYDLASYLREGDWQISDAGWPGKCRRDPVAQAVRSCGWCASWRVNPSFLRTLEQIWNRAGADKEIRKLRMELKKERERSLERYHQLRKRKPIGSAR